MDDALGDIEHGTVLVDGALITDVGRDVLPPPDAEIIDATGMIVIPGFVDSHKHLWQTALRGIVADLTLIDYFTIVREKHLSRFRPEDAGLGTYAGALELIASGTTTVLDHSHGVVTPEHGEAIAEGILESGIRGVWAYGFAGDSPSYRHGDRIADARRMGDQLFQPNRMMRLGIAPSDLGRSSWDAVEAELDLARELDAIWTTHTHCAPGNMPATRGFHRLLARGYINERAVLSHCNEFGADDFSLVVDAGAHYASTPDTEIGFGIPAPPPYAAALAAGVMPALGTDCVTCMSSDMFAAMRQALNTARAQVNVRSPLEVVAEQRITTRDVLTWATTAGARALGLEATIGSLTPGKAADLVLVDARGTNMTPVVDPVASLVLHAHAGNVDTVLIDGVIRKRGGELVGVDWSRIADDLIASSSYLVGKA
jgi:cytosine/adenosine deaminase-related metal-dependent hydrolase